MIKAILSKRKVSRHLLSDRKKNILPGSNDKIILKNSTAIASKQAQIHILQNREPRSTLLYLELTDFHPG